MRRKIIKQGENSYTITLPIAWARKKQLDQIPELEVEETDEGLLVRASPRPATRKNTTVTLEKADDKNIRLILQQLYRQNYSTITIKTPNADASNLVEDIAEDYFLGLEVVDKQPKSCTLSALIESDEEKFNLFLRRQFHQIKNALSQFITRGRYQDIRKSYLKLSGYQNYCKRYVYNSRSGLDSYDFYALFSYLLNIHSDIERMSRHYVNVAPPKALLKEYESFIDIFNDVENAFFKKDLAKLSALTPRIEQETNRLCVPRPTKKNEFVGLHYLCELYRLFYGATSPMGGIILFEQSQT